MTTKFSDRPPTAGTWAGCIYLEGEQLFARYKLSEIQLWSGDRMSARFFN